MKVMHILNTGSYSGAESVVISIISHMKEDVECVYVSLQGSIGEILIKNGIKYYPVEKLTVGNIKNVIKKEKPDVIHAHDFTAGIITSMCTTSTPVVSHLHNNPPWIKKFNARSIVYGLSCIKYKKILTVSDSVMNEYVFGKFFKKKSEVIGNPVITNDIKIKAGDAEFNNSFDIVFLGRFTLQKDPEAFLQIIQNVRNMIPSINVGMIGTGEMFDEIQEKIKQMNLDGCIMCLGFIDNPYGILKASKLLCVPSRWEGFGLVAIEALALGKPVIAANVGGLPGIVNEKSGRVCNDTNDYVDEICKLLTDVDYYNQISAGAAKRAESLDNEKTYFKHIKSMYELCVRE